jgi:hypothetical protein
VKSPLLIILVLGVAFVLGVVGLFVRAEIQKQGRETAYQAVLTQDKQALRLGTSRQEVEDYLRMKNAHFIQMCCAESPPPSDEVWDDLVLIGYERTPWYDPAWFIFCNADFVNVAFQFTSYGPTGPFNRKSRPLDKLKAITIYRQHTGCPP